MQQCAFAHCCTQHYSVTQQIMLLSQTLQLEVVGHEATDKVTIDVR